jgi:threonine dehydrogenase-like Zn-dependent dehydrogenase
LLLLTNDRVLPQPPCIGLHCPIQGIGSDAIVAPFVPGHEFSACLVADDAVLGRAGQRVAVDPGVECGVCEWCSAGDTNLCSAMKFIGAPPHHGALQPTICVPRRNVYRVPDGMTADEVAMLEPLGIALHAVGLTPPPSGSDVVVLGAGPVGRLIAQVALLHGPRRVMIIEPVEARRAAAAEGGMGPTVVVGSRIEDVDAWTRGRGAGKSTRVPHVRALISHAGHVLCVRAQIRLQPCQQLSSVCTFWRARTQIWFTRPPTHAQPSSARHEQPVVEGTWSLSASLTGICTTESLQTCCEGAR